jgi:ATP adenylyltransferase
MERLFSPWRLRYVASGRKMSSGCVFCRAQRLRSHRRGLILHAGMHNLVILNKYPYNNGHLMVVPKAHLASPRQAPPASLLEMMELAVRCETALRTVYRPSGINLGMNLGRSAGAGIAGHYHLHIVPRWDGDTNFMTAIHGTRVIPEALDITYRRLRRILRHSPRGARRSAGRAPVERPRRRR